MWCLIVPPCFMRNTPVSVKHHCILIKLRTDVILNTRSCGKKCRYGYGLLFVIKYFIVIIIWQLALKSTFLNELFNFIVIQEFLMSPFYNRNWNYRWGNHLILLRIYFNIFLKINCLPTSTFVLYVNLKYIKQINDQT